MPSALIGKQAPTVEVPDQKGDIFKLAPGQKGLPTALFFYPKAGTYGCTREVCQFRDAIAEKPSFATDKVEVIGVSPDPVDKQKAFAEKQKVTYPLLCDDKGEARKAYGVGKGIFGLTESSRVTFIIDAKGVVRDSLDATVNFGAHSKFVSRWLTKLEEETKGAAPYAPEPPEVAAADKDETEIPPGGEGAKEETTS